MGSHSLNFTVLSAKQIVACPNIGMYTVAKITGHTGREQKTTIDGDGGPNPRWNFPMKFNVDKTADRQNKLIFQIHYDLNLDHEVVGVVHLPLAELIDNTEEGIVSYPVWILSLGKFQGELNIYKFGAMVRDEPVIVYPVLSPMGTNSVYGGPSQAPLYGQYPPVQPPKKFGMELVPQVMEGIVLGVKTFFAFAAVENGVVLDI